MKGSGNDFYSNKFTGKAPVTVSPLDSMSEFNNAVLTPRAFSHFFLICSSKIAKFFLISSIERRKRPFSNILSRNQKVTPSTDLCLFRVFYFIKYLILTIFSFNTKCNYELRGKHTPFSYFVVEQDLVVSIISLTRKCSNVGSFP